MWGPKASSADLADRYLALSYHTDASALAVLNTETGRYFMMDACGADEKCPMGISVGDLLDWVWRFCGP